MEGGCVLLLLSNYTKRWERESWARKSEIIGNIFSYASPECLPFLMTELPFPPYCLSSKCNHFYLPCSFRTSGRWPDPGPPASLALCPLLPYRFKVHRPYGKGRLKTMCGYVCRSKGKNGEENVPATHVVSQYANEGDRVTLVVDNTRFVVDPSLFTARPNTMLGRYVLCFSPQILSNSCNYSWKSSKTMKVKSNDWITTWQRFHA